MTPQTAPTFDTRSRISTLWIVVLFSIVLADILGFITPGTLREFMTGHAGSLRITPEILLVFAVLLEIPVAMVFLSRVLKDRANRVTNIVAGVVTIAFVIGGGTLTLHYAFFAAVEVACLLLIIRYASTMRARSTPGRPGGGGRPLPSES
jgi:hypothetical protein